MILNSFPISVCVCVCVCDNDHEHIALRGKDQFGNFVTAPFKQYQSPMNRLLASAFHTKCSLTIQPAHIQPDEMEDVLDKFFVPLDPHLEQHALGHFAQDCATHNQHTTQY